MNKILNKVGLIAAMMLLAAGSVTAQTASDTEEVKMQQVEGQTINVQTGEAVKLDVARKQRTEEAIARRQLIQEDIKTIRTITPEAYEALSADEKAEIDNDPKFFVTDQDKRQIVGEYVRKKYFSDKADADKE